MSNKKIIYFLCTGNSCRSQMAEGFAKKFLGDTYEIYSAGIDPLGIDPVAIQVMQEKRIDITGQTSDAVSTKLINSADFVITLCKDSSERCPVVLPRAYHYHWALEDPAKEQGTYEEILEKFRWVRDEIEKKTMNFIQGDAGIAIDIKDNLHLHQREDFGGLLQAIRLRKGITVQELATQLEVTEAFLVKTEQNHTQPSKFFIHHLVNFCQIDYEDLIDHLYYVKNSDILKLIK